MSDEDKVIRIDKRAADEDDMSQFGVVIGDVHVGGDIGLGGTIKGDSVNIQQSFGDDIWVSGDLRGDKVLSALFDRLSAWARDRADEQQRQEALELVEKLQAQIEAADEANPTTVGTLLSQLRQRDADIWNTVVVALSNPRTQVATIIQMVAKKARYEATLK